MLGDNFCLDMSSDIKRVMSQAIAQLCYQVGFDRISESALDLLVDVGEQYIRNFAILVTKVSTLYGGSAELEDGILALRLLRQSPRGLLRFSEEVGPYFSNQPPSCTVPLVGKICLNVPPENHEELESRPDYIPDYLPLNFDAAERIDADQPVFVKSKVTESLTSKTDEKQTESKIVATNAAASITPVSRVLPAWAQQTSYRIARVSIDPITKSLVEHAAPEKNQDLSPDISSSVRSYGHPSTIPMFSEVPKMDMKAEVQKGFLNSSLSSVSYRQGSTDEQWAAALQATPVARPTKRIVYTPSRFDPSAVPTHTSSVRRSTSSSAFSTSIRRFSGSQAADTNRKRPTHSGRLAANAVPKLTTTNRRRRGAFGRARPWAKKRSVRKNTDTSETTNSSVVMNPGESLNMLPSADNTPELRTDHESPCLVSTVDDHDQADSRSDHTPPTRSPMSARRLRKISPVNSHGDGNSSVLVSQSVSGESEVKEELGDVLNACTDATTTTTILSAIGNSSPIPPSPVRTDSPNFIKTNISSISPQHRPQHQPKTHLSPPVMPEVVVEQMNAAPVSLPSPVRDRLRGQRKGRGRRRIAPRTSIISSLFQNPLRKKTVVKPPPPLAVKPSDRKNNSAEEQPSTASTSHPSQPPTATSLKDDNTLSPRSSTPTVKHSVGKSGRHRTKRPSSPLCKTDSSKLNSEANSSSVTDRTTNLSPASDSTEPMLDAERANLLLILQSPNDERILNVPVKCDLTVPVAKANTYKLELGSVPFPGKNFDRPRNLAPITVRALPSSPSSLESSPSSSLSSTSTSLLEGPVVEHRESRVPNAVIYADDVVPSPEIEHNDGPVDPTHSKTRQLSLEVPKEDCLYVPPLSSSNSSVPTSATIVAPLSGGNVGLNTSGPPPLLPFNKQSFDVSFPTSSLQQLSSCVNSVTMASPPSLVPVSELQKPPSTLVKPTSSLTNVRPPSSGQVPSNTAGGLRIKIRFGASEVRESVTSSLSPSSSSSSLSSGSSPSSPYVPERMPAPMRDPPVSPGQMTVTSKEIKAGGSSDLKSIGDPAVSEHSSLTKTPKLVIRLGANAQPINPTCDQPPNLWSAVKINSEGASHPVFMGGESRSCTGVNAITTPLPPPLQLTITRDRLSYRGRTASDASDSNLTSSSGTESLLSSGDDEECISSPSKQSTLPPPPSLERLPDRCGLVTSGSDRLRSVAEFTSHTVSSKSAQSTGALSSPVTHNQLPPLLPLFSSSTENSSRQTVGTPRHLSALDGFRTSNSSGPPSPRSASTSKKKRPRSTRKHIGPSSKRKCTSSAPLAGNELNVPPEQSSFLTVSSSRVRVDSVFTDNESDDNSVPAMPHLITVNPPAHEVQSSITLALRNPESETNTKDPGEMKYGRTQPRTKHTASIHKAIYPPAIKVATLDSPQSAHTLSRDRNARKHFPSSSSSTGSSGAKSRVTGGSYRPSSSQVVVASAGSSYYFNSVGEQIWLCPICLLEDDGNLMIGCDSCDDWYHSTCLGLSTEPEDPHWFCPRCAGQPLSAGSGVAPVAQGPVQLNPLPVSSLSNTNKKRNDSTHRSLSKHAKRGTKR